MFTIFERRMNMAIKKRALIISLLTSLVLCIAVCLGAFALPESTGSETERRELSVALTGDEAAAKVDIVTGTGSDYMIVFAPSTDGAYDLAKKLSNNIFTLTKASFSSGVRLDVKSAVAQKETAHEILIGNTNRAFSSDVLKVLEDYGSADEILVWAYAYKDGKLAYVANSNTAFAYGLDDFLAVVAADGTLSVESDLFVIKTKSMAEYKEEIRIEEERKEQEYLESLKEKNNEFEDSQFNTDKFTPGQFYKPIIDENGNGYFTTTKSGEPYIYPSESQHPSYLITSKSVDRIKEILEEGKSKDSVYYNMVQNFWKLADADETQHLWGCFPTMEYKNTGRTFNYDGTILSIIDAKAMAYLVTGNEKYAYEAIICIKNAMLTLNYTTDLHMDVYHGPSHVMVTLAAVYDWCYDVLSETDKWQMIWGTAQILGPQMEAGYRYPPSGFNGVNGHGTGPQLLRDWMSVAVVFYGEAPDWYRYIAGRYFNEYLPVANEQFVNGWVSQGTACYAPIKIHVHAWAAYLIYTSTGDQFLTDDAHQTMYYFMSHITPRQTNSPHQQYYFQTGDGTRSPGGTQVSYEVYLVIAALYNDPTLFAHARRTTQNFKTYTTDTIFTMTPSFMLAFSSAIDYDDETDRDGVGTIQYFASPASSMTLREAWDDPDSIAVLMRVMNLTMSNHEGADHGTFQIYYKGLLAGTSGAYDKYGSDAHYYYHQCTIAHNGLLIFNPAMADATPTYKSDGYSVSNASRYYYSGSQRRAQVNTSSAADWLASAEMAETLGAAYGYDDEGNAKYGYLAADLTQAYDAATVDYVGRRMFTLFTGDEDFPMLFFTFDQIMSDDENFTKHWLLHTIKEPEIDQDNLTATVINGEGKMYLQSLYGAQSIMKVGGVGKAFWINGYFADPTNKGSWNSKLQAFDDPDNIGSWVEGKNTLDGVTTNDRGDSIWGRLELRAEGEKYTTFFNVLAVTDTDNDTKFEISKFNFDDLVYGAQFKNSVVAFLNNSAKPAENRYYEFSFTTEGKGLCQYYIGGLEAGTWQVFVDGVSVAYTLADEGESFITFTAPAGNVTVKPGDDVIGANGGKITYSTGGGVLPSDAPYSYKSDTGVDLPTTLSRGDDVFVGWYTTPTYDEGTEVTAVPVGTTGTYKVYAKWISNFLNEDYTLTKFNVKNGNTSQNGVSYNGSGKAGSSFITKTDADGVNYLEWTEGTQDPMIMQTSTTKNFSMLGSDDKCISFTFKLRLNEGSTPMQTDLRLIAKQDVTGAAIGSTCTYIFKTTTDGTVISNNGKTVATLSEDKVTSVRVIVDFKNGEMRYYDDDYRVIVTDKFSAPAQTKAKNTEEFLKCLTQYLWYFYGGTSSTITDAALRIYGMRIQEGDEFTALEKPQTEGIKYNTNGAQLPDGVQRDFNTDGTITVLPTNLSLAGHKFDGWYTTPTFDEGTRTTYVPANYEGLYEVWAKWSAVFLDEDYSSANIDHTESNKSHNGISYNGNGKPGSSFKTVTSDDGTKYLLWSVGSSDPIIMMQNTLTNISTMSDNSVSYTITLGKNGTANLPDLEFRLIGKHNTDGSSATKDSNIYFARLVDGELRLGSTSTVIANVGDKPVTVRIVIDFEAGAIKAYNELGEVIASTALSGIPTECGAKNTLEWKQCFRNYLFYIRRINGNSSKAEDAIRIYGLKIEEGNSFIFKEGEEPPKANSIIYETNEGKLPDGAPSEYDPSLGTVLPTDVTKDGYIFGGWYANASCTGARIDYVPAGSTAPVKVYAKWFKIVRDEDWEKTEIDHGESSMNTVNNMFYNTGSSGEQKPGTGFKTVKDDNGNTYLKFWSPSYGVFLVSNDAGYQFADFKETAMSFEFEYGRDGDLPLANCATRLQSSGANYGQRALLAIDGATGEAKLEGSNKVIATIGAEMVKFRITVDFAAATVTAYDENGNVIDSASLGAVPTSKSGYDQPTSWVEWMKYSTGNFVYNQFSAPTGFTQGDGLLYGARYDSFKVIDGRPYGIKFETELPKVNGIVYKTNGGTLADGAPDEYEGETELPIPTKKNSNFLGWYTTSDFAEGTRIEKIAEGTEGIVTLYARWSYIFADEDFESKDMDATDSTKYNDIGFNLSKVGSTAKTVLDEQGNKYIKVSATSNDAMLMLQNDSHNLTTMTETQLSIQMDLVKSGDITSNLGIKLATSGNAYGQVDIAALDGATGEIKLVGSEKVIGKLHEDGRVTLRLLIDFAAAKAYAYDAEGNVIDTANLTVPTIGGAESLAVWQKVATNYLLYAYMTNPEAQTAGTESSVGFDNIKIFEGFNY